MPSREKVSDSIVRKEKEREPVVTAWTSNRYEEDSKSDGAEPYLLNWIGILRLWFIIVLF